MAEVELESEKREGRKLTKAAKAAIMGGTTDL